MEITITSAILGSSLVIVSLIIFILNITVLAVLIGGGFIKSSSSTLYILAFANIFGNACLTFFYTVYLGPSSIIQNFLFGEDLNSVGDKLVGFLYHGLWGTDLLIQVVTSINRLIMIMYPSKKHFFTPSSTFFLALMCYFFGYFLAFIGDYIVSCCGAYLYYKSYSHTFRGTSFNVTGNYLYLPFNITCSIIAIGCYVKIYIYTASSYKKTSKSMGKSSQAKRKIQEIKLAFQLAFCTFACTFTWVFLRIFSLIFPDSNNPIYIIVSLCQIIHASSNSLVFLLFNHDIKTKFRQIFLQQTHVSSSYIVGYLQSSRSKI